MPELKNISAFKSGEQKAQYQYRSFLPGPVYFNWVVDVPELQKLLSEADQKLGMLNAFASLIPDVDFFIQMHIKKEATTSSRIEGTQTNLQDVLINQDNVNPENRDDREEVINYIKAINYSIERCKKLGIVNRLIKETHRVLMQGVRGQHKNPGAYRTSQNWIGATLRDAVYIPPHHEDIAGLMADFEKFLNADDIHTPPLIRIAILHYQFETIHPFLDGNGRMGRLLITLYLVDKGLMVKPALYLSDFFEQNRNHYYDNLHRVRTHNDMTQWLKFFLAGVIETAQNSIETFKNILKLKQKIENAILPSFGSRQSKALEVMNYFYRQPAATVSSISTELNMHYASCNRIVNDLVKAGILKDMNLGVKHRFFLFDEYVKLFSKSQQSKKK